MFQMSELRGAACCLALPLSAGLAACRLQICQRPFKVSDTYTAPKGSLLMPSIIAANMQVCSSLVADCTTQAVACSWSCCMAQQLQYLGMPDAGLCTKHPVIAPVHVGLPSICEVTCDAGVDKP